MAQGQAFTIKSKQGLLRALVTQIGVCTPVLDFSAGPDRHVAVPGIWDTGATGSVITQKVIDDLELQPIGLTQVNGVGGQETSPVYLVDFALPNHTLIQGLRVTRGKLAGGAEALIGMDVIAMGDFSVTNFEGKTMMSFRVPSCEEVDYVAEPDRPTDTELTDESGRKLSRQERKQADKAAFKKWQREQKRNE